MDRKLSQTKHSALLMKEVSTGNYTVCENRGSNKAFAEFY